MQCANCGFESSPEMSFCGQCGTRLKQVCPECHFANPLDYRYCGNCGIALAYVTTTEVFEETEPSSHPPEGLITPVIGEAPLTTQNRSLLLEGERRQATVLIADVLRSTKLLEQIGTEAWVALMSDVLQLVEAEVYRFGGEVHQFRGDGLIAFFGATVVHEDDPERAVLAALAVQTVLEPFSVRLLDEKDIELRVRIGVNTGEVIVTSIGESHQHREDTAMGQAVTVAQRLEEAAEPGTVLASASTYRRTQHQFEWQPMSPLIVGDLAEPLDVYRPLRVHPDRKGDRTQRLRSYGLSLPLVGREPEFAELKQAVENLASGRGGIVLLTGDQGVGKSRLVLELKRNIYREVVVKAETQGPEPDRQTAALMSLTWLRGQCRSYEQSWPYAMWHDLMRRWLSVGEGESVEEISRRLYNQSLVLWGEETADYYPFLAVFLGLPLLEPFAARIKHLDAQELRLQIYAAIRGWLEALAGQGPLVVTFNNIQWADTSSLDLLAYCLSICDHDAVLWILVMRSKPISDTLAFFQNVMTQFPHRVKNLALNPLSDAQIGEVVDRLVGTDGLPAETRDLIIRNAEGNPYYVEELVYTLIEQGDLVRDTETGQWRAARGVASMDLPDTLQGLLLSRLDSLTPDERRLSQLAAVIGDIFWANLLETMVDDPAALKKHLTALQRAQLIEERGLVPDLGMEYAFRSKMMRQVIYESVLSKQQEGFHRQVAEFLEQHFNNDAPQQYYSFLAHHYRQANERSKELLYMLLAATEAKEAYANTEALLFNGRALELLDELEEQTTDEQRLYAIRSQKLDLLNERCDLYTFTGDFQAGQQTAQSLLPLARQLDDPAWVIDALLRQPGVAYWRSKDELPAGQKLAKKALGLARQIDDQRREMQSLIALARLGNELDDPSTTDYADQALALARQLDQPYTEAELLIAISSYYYWTDEPELGHSYLEAAIPICQKLDDKVAEIQLLGQISRQYERYGDYYRALTECQQPRLKLSREVNHRSLEADALMSCGQIQGIQLGDHETGLAVEEEARHIWRDTPGEGVILLRITQLLTDQGNYDEALETLQQVYRMDTEAFHEMVRMGLYLVSAILYHAIGDPHFLQLALDRIEQARKLVLTSPRLSRHYEIATEAIAAAVHLALSEIAPDEATESLQLQQALESSSTALAIYEEFGYAQVVEYVSEEVFFRHSQVLVAVGRYEDSTVYLQQAYDEMMRKYALIPIDSIFRQTFLENIPIHREIEAAFNANMP